MGQNNREIGSKYEQTAGSYLESLGYEILEYNMRCHAGEVDIVAREGEYIVFVEVKYRANAKCGAPLEAISVLKQKTISKCALSYLKKHRLWDVSVRFDVVGILKDEITLIRNAFEFYGRTV